MIQIGCCTSIRQLETIRDAGFAYAEINLSEITAMDEEAFVEAAETARKIGLPILAANCFLPGEWPLAHAPRDPEQDGAYLAAAARRLKRLGCPLAVLGSGGPRSVREEYGVEKGKRQFLDFYRQALAVFAQEGMILAIEPLRRAECTWLNSVREGLALIKDLPEDNRGVICDFYHLAQEDESLEDVTAAGALLRHCHIAHPVTRKAPAPGDGADYARYARTLWDIGYDGLVSFEGDWESDPALLKRCREYLNAVFVK